MKLIFSRLVDFWDSFFIFFKQYEKFLVIEVGDETMATEVKADFSAKKLFIKKPRAVDRGALAVTAAVFRKFIGADKKTVILGLPEFLAFTVSSPVLVAREDPKSAIDEADLDNIIFQATWRLFDRWRLPAAKKLKVGEIDVVLANVRVLDVKVDGHKVLNPVGFTAKTAEVMLSETMVARRFSEVVKSRFGKSELRVAETGSVTASLFGNLDGKEAIFTLIADEKTRLFIASPRESRFLDEFLWGLNSVYAAVAEELSVSPAAGKAIYGAYLAGNVSARFYRFIDGIFASEFGIFVKGVETAAAKFLRKPKVITVYPRGELPDWVFTKRLSGIKMIKPDEAFLLERTGFNAPAVSDAAGKNFFGALSLFLEAYLSGEKKLFNRLAARRAKWLTSV